MAFQFTDQHIDEYHTRGLTVFRGILPPSLLHDLRRVTDRAREIAREKHGPQSQRLQPVAAYDLDQRPFEEYHALPELRDAVTRLLTPRHQPSTREWLGVLLEPASLPWCTQWHRDWHDRVPGIDPTEFEAARRDTNLFNQVNCALYDDSSTWVVPGSHLRADLPRERARFPDWPIPGPELEGRTYEERERLCLGYCESLPGAVPVHLNAGDYALYRNSLWHLGSYVPYNKRATLHDLVDTPEFAAWRESVGRRRKESQ